MKDMKMEKAFERSYNNSITAYMTGKEAVELYAGKVAHATNCDFATAKVFVSRQLSEIKEAATHQ